NGYLRWCWHGLGQPDLDLIDANLWSLHFKLGGNDWCEQLESAMANVCPSLIIFDTATPCFNIQDENDNSEASAVIQRLRQVQAMYNQSTIVVLRHAKTFTEAGEDGHTIRKARGATTWKASTDAT